VHEERVGAAQDGTRRAAGLWGSLDCGGPPAALQVLCSKQEDLTATLEGWTLVHQHVRQQPGPSPCKAPAAPRPPACRTPAPWPAPACWAAPLAQCQRPAGRLGARAAASASSSEGWRAADSVGGKQRDQLGSPRRLWAKPPGSAVACTCVGMWVEEAHRRLKTHLHRLAVSHVREALLAASMHSPPPVYSPTSDPFMSCFCTYTSQHHFSLATTPPASMPHAPRRARPSQRPPFISPAPQEPPPPTPPRPPTESPAKAEAGSL
jgi:hypothetical protein